MIEQARVRLIRKVGIVLSWAIWLAVFCVAFLTHTPQIYLVGLFFLGFAPYLLAINIIEPWLAKRPASGSSGGGTG
jgi:hypothetical protein